jgi:hypothetical protein
MKVADYFYLCNQNPYARCEQGCYFIIIKRKDAG